MVCFSLITRTWLLDRISFMFTNTLLLGANERKEHVECNLNSVDKDQTVLG